MNKDENMRELLSKWVHSARKHAKMSLEALGEALGRTKQTVWAMENGRIEPSYRQLVRISEITGYKISLPGMHAFYYDNEGNSLLKLDSHAPPSEGYIRLNYLDIDSSPGEGKILELEYPVMKRVDVLEDWALRSLGRNASERIRLINNVGDSMVPTINDGDILFVDITVNHYTSDGIYVINFNKALLTKRLVAQPDGSMKIVSDNKVAYESMVVRESDHAQLKICGRVVAWWSMRSY